MFSLCRIDRSHVVEGKNITRIFLNNCCETLDCVIEIFHEFVSKPKIVIGLHIGRLAHYGTFKNRNGLIIHLESSVDRTETVESHYILRLEPYDFLVIAKGNIIFRILDVKITKSIEIIHIFRFRLEKPLVYSCGLLIVSCKDCRFCTFNDYAVLFFLCAHKLSLLC